MTRASAWLALLLSALALSACAAPSRTTRLRVEDFEDVAIEMAAKLRASSFLAGRSPESPPLVVTLTKVENLSSDILSEGEKWYLVERVIDADAIADLRRSDNVRFVIPAEKLRLLRDAADADIPIAPERDPTHVMTARLTSLVRTASLDRTDLYDAEFRIVELATGEVVWSDHVALKRVARGKAYD